MHLVHRQGQVCSVGQICHDLCPFLILDAGMRSVLLFCSPVAIQSTWVLTQAYSPLGYLSFHHLLLDLPPSGYL
jgi:hypothetical protein